MNIPLDFFNVTNPRIWLQALVTLITGAGIITVFDKIPHVVKTLFDNPVMEVGVLSGLVWQSGQNWAVSLVAGLVFYVVIEIMVWLDSRNDPFA